MLGSLGYVLGSGFVIVSVLNLVSLLLLCPIVNKTVEARGHAFMCTCFEEGVYPYDGERMSVRE